jgi:hypothetical protein
MGGLADVLRANHQRAGDLVHDFGSISDLIKSATGNTQLQFSILQQSGLPATMDWVRFLSQGGDAIRTAAFNAGQFGSAADQQMIAKSREFDESWNTAIKNLKTGLQGATISAAGWLDTLSDRATALLIKLPGVGASVPNNLLRNSMTNSAAGYDVGSRLTSSSAVDQFYSPLGKNAPGNSASSLPVDYTKLQHLIAVEQQHIGLLGQTATATDAVRSVELQVQAARLSGVSITNQQVDTLKRLAAEQSLGITQIKSQTDAYGIETATIGMSAGATAQYTAFQNALNEAKRSGRLLTDANIASISAEAAKLGQAAAQADLMRSAYTGLVQGPLQTLSSSIANGAKFFDALKSAGVSALTSISSKLADMAAQNLWQAALGGSSSNGGLLSLLHIGGSATSSAVGSASTLGSFYHSGGIVGSESTFQRYIHPAYFDDAPRFHTGLMPDEFPAILQRGEGVFTRGQMAAMGSGGNVTVSMPINIDATGADAAGLARVEQKLADLKANIPGMTVAAVKDAQKRRLLQ